MYEHRSELKVNGKFPILWIHQGKARAEAIEEMASEEIEDRKTLLRKQAQQLKSEDAQGIGKSNKAIKQEEQNSKKVPPKDIAEIPTSQALDENSNLQSTTQKADLVASPQLEDGFTRISNEILEAMARINLSGYQSRILMVVWRKTYGWQKKEDYISLNEISKATGINKRNVSRTLNELIGRNIIIKNSRKLQFNKNYNKWRGLQRKGINLDTLKGGVYSDTKGIYLDTSNPLQDRTGKAPQFPKETNKRKLFCLNSNEFRLSDLLLSLILERRNTFKRPDPQKWAKHIDLMIRIDNREPEEIEKVIRWCQGNSFWQNNILSTGKLRVQFDQLALKMGEENNEGSRPKRFDEEDW